MAFLRLLIIGVTAFAVGCGGGGGDPVDPGVDGGDGGDGGGGNGGGNGGGGGIEVVNWTAEELMAAIDEVQEVVQDHRPSPTVDRDTRDLIGELETTAAAVAALDEVVAVKVMRGTVTAQVVLRDGTFVLIQNNRPYDDGEPGGAPPAGHAADGRLPGVGASALPRTLRGPQLGPPRSAKAVAVAIDGGESVAGEVASMLAEAGYEVTPSSGFLEEMRQFKGLGALYLDTHLGSYKEVEFDDAGTRFIGDSRLALQTNSLVGTDILSAYEIELQAKDVLVALDLDDGRATLAITESFIEKNWSFDEGVVMIHACYFGAPAFRPDEGPCYGSCSILSGDYFDPTPLQNAVLAAGAELLISFDNYTNANYARPSILFFFDRMLGAGTFMPQSPLARPFPGDEVWSGLINEGLFMFERPSYTLGPLAFGGNDVNLTFHGSLGQGKLAPSIERFEIVDDAGATAGTMTLNGVFGDNAGEVLVDDRSVPVDSWTDEQIVAQVPFDGYAGDVVVRTPTGGVESNEVPLTEWIGGMTFTFDPGQQSLMVEVEVDVHFRADVHRYRETLDGDPQPPQPVVAYVSGASSGTSKGSGMYSEGVGSTVRYTGEEPLRILSKARVDGPPTPPGGVSEFGGRVRLNPEAGTARVCVRVFGYATVELDTGLGDPIRVRAPLMQTFVELFDSLDGGLACLDLSLSQGSLSIPGGQKQHTEDEATYKLEWTGWNAISPPDGSTAS